MVISTGSIVITLIHDKNEDVITIKAHIWAKCESQVWKGSRFLHGTQAVLLPAPKTIPQRCLCISCITRHLIKDYWESLFENILERSHLISTLVSLDLLGIFGGCSEASELLQTE